MQSVAMSQYAIHLSVRLSVRPSVTFRYRDHIGWNTLKIISRPKCTGRPQNGRSVSTGTRLKLWWNRGRVMSTKTCNISETVQDRTRVTMMDSYALSIDTKINDLE